MFTEHEFRGTGAERVAVGTDDMPRENLGHLVNEQWWDGHGPFPEQTEIGRFQGTRCDQAIAKIQDHPIILHRVRVGEGCQIFAANGAARIIDEFCVQRQLCATRFFDRRYLRALPVGAQKVVGDC